MVRIERVGLNLADFEIPDNHGRKARDEPLSGNGPAAKFATLPVRKIEEAMLAAGIPSRISNSAGSFLCNACLYSFLSAAEEEAGYPLRLHSRAVPARAGGRSAPRTEEGGEARSASARRLRLDGFGDRHQGGGDCA